MGVLETDYEESSVTQREAVIGARLLGGSLFPQTAARSATVTIQSGLGQRLGSFRAILQVGETVSLPEESFDFHPTDEGGYLQRRSTSRWPVVRIYSGKIEVHCADQSVEGDIFRTRLLYALNAEGKCYLRDPIGNSLIELAVGKMSSQEFENLLFLGRIYRKLKFIEERFRTSFVLPQHFTGRDIRDIEFVFCGITEGEFSSRSDEIIFLDFSPSPAELSAPPFSEPGRLSRTFPNPYFILLGHALPVGPHTMILERTAVANPRELTTIGKNKKKPSTLRFIVFDSQVRYRFEKYARRSPQERRRRLEQFRNRLLQEEPEELVQLLTQPLISDVSSERAIQIVNGWLQYYDFPDRYCPQDPVLEGDQWRVPVWITYPTVRGAKVEDLFVNVKTGVISARLTPAEMRDLGKSIASKILRAS